MYIRKNAQKSKKEFTHYWIKLTPSKHKITTTSIIYCKRIIHFHWSLLKTCGGLDTITKHGKKKRTQNQVRFFYPRFCAGPLRAQSTYFAISD